MVNPAQVPAVTAIVTAIFSWGGWEESQKREEEGAGAGSWGQEPVPQGPGMPQCTPGPRV